MSGGKWSTVLLAIPDEASQRVKREKKTALESTSSSETSPEGGSPPVSPPIDAGLLFPRCVLPDRAA